MVNLFESNVTTVCIYVCEGSIRINSEVCNNDEKKYRQIVREW